MKSKLRAILLFAALQIGVFFGVPMRPEEVQDLMRRLQGQKIVHTLPDANDKRDRSHKGSISP
jgi:hypothetical protein